VEVVLVLLFFGADLALVVWGLLKLSERRTEQDVTDMRNRERRRYR
jgi:hypothetical protein